MKIVMDVSQLQSYLNVRVKVFIKRFPGYADRLHLPLNKRLTRETILRLLWNNLHRRSQYDFGEWDVNQSISKWFDDYNPDGYYHDRKGIMVSDDPESLEFFRVVIDYVDEKITDFLRSYDMWGPWKINELYDVDANGVMIKNYGDWRAREYCIIQGVEYVP